MRVLEALSVRFILTMPDLSFLLSVLPFYLPSFTRRDLLSESSREKPDEREHSSRETARVMRLPARNDRFVFAVFSTEGETAETTFTMITSAD
jgi:hypothetical protein